MSDVQDAANEFFEALVKHVVDGCIDVALDTAIVDGGGEAYVDAVAQRDAIIKGLKQYRNDPYSRIKAAA